MAIDRESSRDETSERGRIRVLVVTVRRASASGSRRWAIEITDVDGAAVRIVAGRTPVRGAACRAGAGVHTRRMPPEAPVPSFGALQSFGRYRIHGLLGRGGMGSVYLAEQTGPGGFRREVVLKLIHAAAAEHGDQRQLLLDEAQLTALVHHPNVVTMYEVGEHLGQVFIALERVRGVSLAVLMRRLGGRRLPLAVVAALIAQACDGLHAAHELRRDGQPLRLIHRDVSLSNLMCDVDGRVRVIDFGIARAEVRRIVTDPSAVRGNPAYMAPEQIEGAPLDRSADVYSTALVFYELSTGAHPFKRSLFRGPLAPLRTHCADVPPELDEVVGAALSLDPRDRPPTIARLGAALWEYARARGLAGPAELAEFFRANHLSLEPDPPRREPLDLPRARPITVPRSVTPPGPTADPRALEVVLAGDDPRAREIVLPDGRMAIIHRTPLRGCERGDQRLALSRVADLLPAPLLAGYVGGALRISCEPTAPAGWRAALYIDATQPHTRLEALQLTEDALPHAFDVGHRKHSFRQIQCVVARRIGARLVARPPAAPFVIATALDLTLLAVLLARDDAEVLHVECVCVQR